MLTNQHNPTSPPIPGGLGSAMGVGMVIECLRHCCSSLNDSLFRYNKNFISTVTIYIFSRARS